MERRTPREGEILGRKEGLISLSQAAALFARKDPGRKIHATIVWRYMTRGQNGCVLESVESDAGRCTSVEAVRRFQRKLSRQRDSAPTAHQAPLVPPVNQPDLHAAILIPCDGSWYEIGYGRQPKVLRAVVIGGPPP